MGPRAGLDGCGKSRPTGIRSPDRPARSKSVYRLRYPGPRISFGHFLIMYACLCSRIGLLFLEVLYQQLFPTLIFVRKTTTTKNHPQNVRGPQAVKRPLRRLVLSETTSYEKWHSNKGCLLERTLQTSSPVAVCKTSDYSKKTSNNSIFLYSILANARCYPKIRH